MPRPRTFDEDAVIRAAGELFGHRGFNATSIDDLLHTTGLQRGSLYGAFGSKRNLFEKTLVNVLATKWTEEPESIDLLIVALKELAPIDAPIRAICRRAIANSDANIADLLGTRLLANLKP